MLWLLECDVYHPVMAQEAPGLEPWLGKVLCLPTLSVSQGQREGEGTSDAVIPETIH